MKTYEEVCKEMKTLEEILIEFKETSKKIDAIADAEKRYHIERDYGFGGDGQPYRVYEYTRKERRILDDLFEEKKMIIKREEEEKKAKAEARKIAKAENLGMTLEEYEEMKKTKAKVTRYKREMRECEKEIENLKARMEYMKKFIEENE